MSTIDFLLRIRNFRRNNWRIWHLNMTDNESVLLSLFSSCVVDRHTLLLRKTSLSAGKWSVRGKSGNKDQSLGSSISHYPHVCSVFSGWWDWSQISIHSTPEEGSRFVYCFINMFTLIVCPITASFLSNYFYCEYFIRIYVKFNVLRHLGLFVVV